MAEESYEEAQKAQQIKYELWGTPTEVEMAAAGPLQKLVAEGDSWFDYPPGLDILDQLKRNYGYKIDRHARHGDTLENMTYGIEYSGNFQRESPQLIRTLQAIRDYKPRIVLFSGGGNDIAGKEFDSFFNHKDSGLQVLREDFARYIFFTFYKKCYVHMMESVWRIDPTIHIISHGYGDAIPDGRSVINIMGIRFIGPWLRPAFTRKNVLNRLEAEAVIKKLIGLFNDLLKQLDDENANFHYLDLRPHIQRQDWVNELHLSSDAYKRVAAIFHAEIQSLLNQNP